MPGSTHNLLTPTMIAKEALRLLRNNLVMGNLVYRDYESEFPGSPKKGATVQIRKPVKFQVTKTRARATSYITEYYVTLTCTTQAHVSWSFYTSDLTMSIEDYSERYIRPAAAVLANTVDADLCGLYKNVANKVVESDGFINPKTFMVLGKANQKLDEEAAPPDDRVIVLNPAGHWSMANALSNWNFAQGGQQALRKGEVGTIANCRVFMDQNIKAHTTGMWATDSSTGVATTGRLLIHSTASVPTGIGVNATPNQRIAVMGIAQATTITGLKTGDVLTINDVFAVNPMSGESTGSLRQFVVTADASHSTACTAEDVWVNIYPDVISTGPYKTVSTIPASGSKIWVDEAPGKQYPQNLAFHKNAFALVMVPLEKPDGAWASTVTDDGFSIRVLKTYNIDTDEEFIRLDILYGVKTIYPELACRISGAVQ